jgi:hypothetical protein
MQRRGITTRWVAMAATVAATISLLVTARFRIAYSRGFVIRNLNTSFRLMLESVRPLRRGAGGVQGAARPRAELTARLGATQSVSGRYEVAACPDLEMQIGKRVAAPRRTCGVRRPSSTPGTAVARRRRPRSRQNPGSKAQKTIGSTSLWGLWDQPPPRYFSSATMSSLA